MATGGGGLAGSSSENRPSIHQIMKYIENFSSPLMNDVSDYEKVAKIGQGTFGEVFKAKHRITGDIVALKKILMENEREGFPITALREIRLLRDLEHPNIVKLIEICRSKASQFNRGRNTFFLVFEFCEHDLAGLLTNGRVAFSLGQIKKVMQQLLDGLYHLHHNKILHRDMKSANILLTKEGVVKLADFGLARPLTPPKPGQVARYTNRVVTMWYRAPELLLGDRNYGPPIDIWGAGCIMAELWTRSPILQGNTEQHQLQLISKMCGSINAEVWPGIVNAELYEKVTLPENVARSVKERLRPFVKDHDALDLLDRMFVIDPTRRISAEDALNHDLFFNDPKPVDLGPLLSQFTASMFEYQAPPRRGPPEPRPPNRGAGGGGTQGGGGGRPVPAGQGAKPSGIRETEYQSRVF